MHTNISDKITGNLKNKKQDYLYNVCKDLNIDAPTILESVNCTDYLEIYIPDNYNAALGPIIRIKRKEGFVKKIIKKLFHI